MRKRGVIKLARSSPLAYPLLDTSLEVAIEVAAAAQKVPLDVIATDVLGLFDVGRLTDLDRDQEHAARRFVTLLAKRSLLVGPTKVPIGLVEKPGKRKAAGCVGCGHAEAEHYEAKDDEEAGCHLCHCDGFC